MKQFNGLAEAQEAAKAAGGMRLPAGAYVCRVLGVKFQEGENGNSDMIQVQFDIEEGELKGFFKKQYEESTQEDKKYKGKFTVYCPKDDGSEKDGWTKRAFKTVINAFEDSNNGYHWNWDEQSLKGKVIGGLFNIREYKNNKGEVRRATNLKKLQSKIDKEEEKKDAKEEPAFVPPPEVMATVDENVVAFVLSEDDGGEE